MTHLSLPSQYRKAPVSRDWKWITSVSAPTASAGGQLHPLGQVHLHMLRHSCGFALANRGYDPRLIQDYLGIAIPGTPHITPKRPAAGSMGCGEISERLLAEMGGERTDGSAARQPQKSSRAVVHRATTPTPPTLREGQTAPFAAFTRLAALGSAVELLGSHQKAPLHQLDSSQLVWP